MRPQWWATAPGQAPPGAARPYHSEDDLPDAIPGAAIGRESGVMRNWAGNVTYGAHRVHEPVTIEEVRAIVRSATHVRALGTRHSFSDIADTDGELVSLERLPRRIEFDPGRSTVTVDGGIRFPE